MPNAGTTSVASAVCSTSATATVAAKSARAGGAGSWPWYIPKARSGRASPLRCCCTASLRSIVAKSRLRSCTFCSERTVPYPPRMARAPKASATSAMGTSGSRGHRQTSQPPPKIKAIWRAMILSVLSGCPKEKCAGASGLRAKPLSSRAAPARRTARRGRLITGRTLRLADHRSISAGTRRLCPIECSFCHGKRA